MDGSIPPARRTARNGADFQRAGLANPEKAAEIDRVAERYAVAVTPPMLDLIGTAPDDPIAAQFLPSAKELETTPDERADPIGDTRFSPVKGIVHRYPDRVLLTPTHTCAVYCRFCFRRETVGETAAQLSPQELDAALDYIRASPAVWEVILTGGDPLILSPRRLKEIVTALDAIPHLGVIRIHTRIPAVAPERITAELIDALQTDKAVYVVLHSNHARELTPAALAACRRVVDAGIPMLAQTVLLRGVNDDAATLETLFRTLVRHRIKPYYLHHGDLAPGTSHFRTSLSHGQKLMRQLRGRVSGLCQPEYVLDIPDGHGKVPVGPSYLRADGAIEDWRGDIHAYPSSIAKSGSVG